MQQNRTEQTEGCVEQKKPESRIEKSKVGKPAEEKIVRMGWPYGEKNKAQQRLLEKRGEE